MFSTNVIFRQQEHLVDNQKCQAQMRPLCNKILLCDSFFSKDQNTGNRCGPNETKS